MECAAQRPHSDESETTAGYSCVACGGPIAKGSRSAGCCGMRASGEYVAGAEVTVVATESTGASQGTSAGDIVAHWPMQLQQLDVGLFVSP